MLPTAQPWKKSRSFVDGARSPSEIEAAALFAVARVRGLPLASAVVIDSMCDEPIGPPTVDTATAFGKLYNVILVGVDLL
jgi:hypothetical protein